MVIRRNEDPDRSDWVSDYWVGRAAEEAEPPIRARVEEDDGVDIASDDYTLGGAGYEEVTGYEVTEPELSEIEVEVPIQKYPANWRAVSHSRRTENDWRCEECWFTLCESPAIQTHHVNEDKSDDSKGNLQVLCLKCHAAKHGGGSGMGGYVPPEDIAKMDAWHSDYRARAQDKKIGDAKI